jgi:hypothetical protein
LDGKVIASCYAQDLTAEGQSSNLAGSFTMPVPKGYAWKVKSDEHGTQRILVTKIIF